MWHARSRSTLEIYSQVRSADKRAEQQRVMKMIFPEDLGRVLAIARVNSQLLMSRVTGSIRSL